MSEVKALFVLEPTEYDKCRYRDIMFLAAKQCYSAKPIKCDDGTSIADAYSIAEKEKLIKACFDHNHLTILEHVSLSFVITLPLTSSHQLVRHRIATYSQRSLRRVDASAIEAHKHEAIKRHQDVEYIYDEAIKAGKDYYNRIKKLLLQKGEDVEVCNEAARSVLPTSTSSELVMTMNLRTLINFFDHRCCERAQGDIRDIADQIYALVRDCFPYLFTSPKGAKCYRRGICFETESKVRACAKEKK
jgi:thymidylate synthase (FAD)